MSAHGHSRTNPSVLRPPRHDADRIPLLSWYVRDKQPRATDVAFGGTAVTPELTCTRRLSGPQGRGKVTPEGQAVSPSESSRPSRRTPGRMASASGALNPLPRTKDYITKYALKS